MVGLKIRLFNILSYFHVECLFVAVHIWKKIFHNLLSVSPSVAVFAQHFLPNGQVFNAIDPAFKASVPAGHDSSRPKQCPVPGTVYAEKHSLSKFGNNMK